MNKKSTLLAVALMAASSWTMQAADDKAVDSKDWTAGNYYYLKADSKYLSLCGTKADSVVFKEIKATDTYTKQALDSALWEITKVRTETAGNIVYQFKNKKTQALLSFEKSASAKPILKEGVSEWSFGTDGKISASWDGGKMELAYKTTDGIVFSGENASTFSVEAPNKAYPLKAQQLGNVFSVFQLIFNDSYEGNVFEQKVLVAKDVAADADADKGYVTLRVQGDETFNDGKEKLLGVDTTKFDISGATGVYGAQFVADSTYEAKEGVHTVGNAEFQKFKFTVDLKNDSIAMYVKAAPKVNDETLTATSGGDVRVVYAQLIQTKVLTVSEVEANGKTKGILPLIKAKQGIPTTIPTGSGVYFLKSGSKMADGGKYLTHIENNKLMLNDGKPSVNEVFGQWYIRENNGLYSVVSRYKESTLATNAEIFAVKGMENTYTFGDRADTITVEPQKVDLNDHFLGYLHYDEDGLKNKGFVLKQLIGNGQAYATVTDENTLQVKPSAEDAEIFKLVPVDTLVVGGAQALGDTVFAVSYQLKERFGANLIAGQANPEKEDVLQMSNENALTFRFVRHTLEDKYYMDVVDEKGEHEFYVSSDVTSGNMILSRSHGFFKLEEVEAPEYGTFETGYKRFTTDMKSLTMNPLNLFAEAKQEGQDILKSAYEKDNFSLKLIKSEASTADRPLYFVTTALADATKAAAGSTRYYMVSGKDSALVDAANNYRVHFIANDTIETMKESTANPALWALKVTENGGYLLENQKEVNLVTSEVRSATSEVKAPYVGIVNNVVVMSKEGAEFSIEGAEAPTANESIESATAIKVIGGNGEFQIRNAGGKKVTLSNILGQTIGSRFISSDNESVQTARGVVIVSVEGDKAYKVIVK